MDRRRILQAIGAASVGMGSVNLVSADTAQDDMTGPTVETFDASDRQNVISDAFADDTFRNIVNHVGSDGWKISKPQTEARRVIYEEDGGGYDFIVANAEKISSEKQTADTDEMVAIWIGNDTVGLDLDQYSVAHHVRKTSSFTSGDNMRSNGLFGWDAITVITSDNGTIQERERDFHDQEQSGESKDGEPLSPEPIRPSPPGGDDCCTVDVEIGSDAKWGCTALAIISAGLSGWTCGACIVDPTKGTCALCVIGAAASGISTAHCFSSTVTIQEGVDTIWLSDNDYSCFDFEPSNDKTLMVSESFYNDELPTCEE
ncbi:hypothetical protein Halru_2162 [Halovivax ruber XH-70]|uniref:Uncharacterized protein n=1 Tax=Halovivax ruber (strain DSM 18193 / JCM 13892 / XH-70) TaxID=797302 RepID=L0IAZ5_HALRX|nr:hypothetical protein [Halovivax ruber]AGB16750.1 hypothetical protein Halru_2162 [Halovivax ruber XH-70]